MQIQETYGQLLHEAMPAVIGTDAQYDSTAHRLSQLVRRGRSRTPDETRLMKLLAVLVRDYDERHALPQANMSPQEAIRFLMEQSEKTPADLLSVFGQRSHVSEALNGKREISLEQARKLAKIFSVSPRVFI
jgi:HTH-type transcriptional regulator / antitoxin HigA